MKCKICNQKVSKTFLDKPIGTYVKDEKGKLHIICNQCQSKFESKQEILENFS